MTILSLLLLLALSFNTLYHYIIFDYKYILLALCIPILAIAQKGNLTLRYGALAILFLILFPILKISSLFFLGVACSAIFIIESSIGKVSNNILLLLIIISPVAIFLSEIVGFEIRLQLSQVAADIMNKMNPNIHAEGNIIYNGQAAFYVDAACSGLKMLSLSLISCVLILGYFEKYKKGYISWYIKFMLLSFTLLTVILGNLCRIILLTILQIGTESPLHYLVGIICLIFYTLMPLYFIIKRIKVNTIANKSRPSSIWLKHAIGICILGLLIFTQIRNPKRSEKEPLLTNKSLSQYQFKNMQIVQDNILKIEDESYLMYIKPGLSFYSSDHSPMICWRGSGYKLSKERTTKINGQTVFEGELIKGTDKLYSIWWYQYGTKVTTSQLNWRFTNLVNRSEVHLINVVSYSKDLAKKQSHSMITGIYKKEHSATIGKNISQKL